MLISEGVTSLPEGAWAGFGVGVLADWLAREDLEESPLELLSELRYVI